MEIDNVGYSGKSSDKEPMYQSAPEDSSPVARKTFLGTIGILCLLVFCLLIIIVLCLNGTIPPVNDVHYLRPADVPNMDKYDVVSFTAIPCRYDLPLNITKLVLSPDPLVLENHPFNMEYDMHLTHDMPHDVSLHVMVQKLSPPWVRLGCHNNQGSCVYPNACEKIGKMFGMKSCTNMTKGHHSGTVMNRMIDMMGPLGWMSPGNFLVHARIKQREETFGCVVITFRNRRSP